MKNFKAYCGLTLLLLGSILFLPFLMMLEVEVDFTSSILGSLDAFHTPVEREYFGYQYWGAFVFPFFSVLISFIISAWRNLWTGIVGTVIAFGCGLWTIAIIPALYQRGISADGYLLIGYDFLRAVAVLFLILNVSHTYMIFKRPTLKPKTSNPEVLDDVHASK